MTERTREDASVEELLNDLRYLWEAQGPQGQLQGAKAAEELLWRFEFLPYDWWDKTGDARSEYIGHTPDEVMVASIAHEAEHRGYDHDLLLDKQ